MAWHRMLYSCTHMVTVGIKGLSFLQISQSDKRKPSVSTCLLSWSTWCSRCAMRSWCLRSWVVRWSFSSRRLPMTAFSCRMWPATMTLSLLSSRPSQSMPLGGWLVVGSAGLLQLSTANSWRWSRTHSDLDSSSCLSRLTTRSATWSDRHFNHRISLTYNHAGFTSWPWLNWPSALD